RARFRGPSASRQRRMIVPPLTRPRVKLGTIAREEAAAAEGLALTVRVAATGPVAPGKSRRRDGLPFAHGRAALMKRSTTVDSRRRPTRRALATLALALLFGLAASEARAGIAFVKNIGTATGNNTGTSITITLAAGVSVAAGNSIIVSFVGPDLSGTYSATDSAAELRLGAVGVAGGASDTFTAGNDGHGGTYTALTRVNSGGNIFYINPEYEIVAATNTYKATATITSAGWAADIATYKADA